MCYARRMTINICAYWILNLKIAWRDSDSFRISHFQLLFSSTGTLVVITMEISTSFGKKKLLMMSR